MNTFLPARRWILGGLLALAAGLVHAEPQAGDVPPPFLGLTTGGDKVRVTDYAGKAVVVTFWATWCRYCLQEMPVLENVQNRAGADKIAVIAVNTEDLEVFRRATRIMNQSMHLTFAHDADQQAQAAYEVHTLPHMVIIGRDGRVVRVWHGYTAERLADIAADINRALAAPRP